MPSSPTTRNRFEKQATGENVNTWGDRLNATLDLIDEAVDGVEPIAIASTAVVLTSSNYASDQARNRVLVLSGTLTGNTTITVPSVEKAYKVINNTAQAGFSLTIKTSSGTGYALRPGPQDVYCDGGDVRRGSPRLNEAPLPDGAVDLNGQNLTNGGSATFSGAIAVATPTAPGHAATKKFVEDTAFAMSAGNLPGQAGNGGKVLSTDGAVAGWYALAALLAGANLAGALNDTAATVASAATTDIGAAAGNAVRITGTAAITSLGTAQAGARRYVTFGGSLTITHNATSLILPGGANIVTAAGDTAAFESLGGGNWRCASYTKASVRPGASLFNAISAKSATYTVTTADDKSLISCSGNLTVTLPLASSVLAGFTVGVSNDGSGAINIVASGSDTIKGMRSISLGIDQGAIITTDGTAWRAIGGSTASATTLNLSDKSPSAVLSNGNLTITTPINGIDGARGTLALSGKVYFEAVYEGIAYSAGSLYAKVGVGTSAASLGAWTDAASAGYVQDGTKSGSSFSAFGASYTTGNIIGIAVDTAAGKVWFSKNGVWQASGDPATGANPAMTLAGTLYPLALVYGTSGGRFTMRFSQTSWTYAAPTGFVQAP